MHLSQNNSHFKEWFGLVGTFRIVYFLPPVRGRDLLIFSKHLLLLVVSVAF